jgi:hypothetical protein
MGGMVIGLVIQTVAIDKGKFTLKTIAAVAANTI